MLRILVLIRKTFLINNCQPAPDVLQAGEITKEEMSIQNHRWLLLIFADNYLGENVLLGMSKGGVPKNIFATYYN